MSVKTELIDGGGKGTSAAVTEYNQLVVGPIGFSTFYNATAGVDDIL